MSNGEEWQIKFNLIKKYIDETNEKPSASNKTKEIKTLGAWINTQQRNYKLKKEIMSDPEIYNKWTEFITSDKYKKHF